MGKNTVLAVRVKLSDIDFLNKQEELDFFKDLIGNPEVIEKDNNGNVFDFSYFYSVDALIPTFIDGNWHVDYISEIHLSDFVSEINGNNFMRIELKDLKQILNIIRDYFTFDFEDVSIVSYTVEDNLIENV